MEEFISKTPRCAFIWMTKKTVDSLLEANTKNRRMRANHVQYIKRLIKSGEFVLSPDAIAIDTNGLLFNGQHRLEALRAEGYPRVSMLVAWGLPPESAKAIDIGLTRTAADIMHFAFEMDASNKVISIARGIKTYVEREHGKPTMPELFDVLTEFWDAMKKAFSVENSSRVQAPVLTPIVYRVHNFKDDVRPLEFLEKIITGAGLEKNDPALMLRNFLIANTAGGSQISLEKFGKTVSALVAHLEGRKIAKLYECGDPKAALEAEYASQTTEKVR